MIFLSYFLLGHPDNALEVCGLLTPLHIVPEWYFLCQYAMLSDVWFLVIQVRLIAMRLLFLDFFAVNR